MKIRIIGKNKLSKFQGGGTPPNCDPGYMVDPNDNTKCILDPDYFVDFKKPDILQNGADEIFVPSAEDKKIEEEEAKAALRFPNLPADDPRQDVIGADDENWGKVKKDVTDLKYESDLGFQKKYDSSIYNTLSANNANRKWWQRNTPEYRKYKKFYNQKYSEQPKKKDRTFGNKLFDFSADATNYINMGYGLSQAYQSYDKNRGYQRSLRDQLANPTIDWTQDYGDYATNFGDFRIRDTGFKGPGQYTNKFYSSAYGPNISKYGGNTNSSDMNKIRIRIVDNPKMAYGGQSGYGFDLGQRNTYSAMKDNPFENISNTVTEDKKANDSEYVLEAEGGETIYKSRGGTKSVGGILQKIEGDPHSRGGVKMTAEQAPTDSFIFSKTKGMTLKDPKIHEFFGLTPRKKGYTPAEISKKYSNNKFEAILADPKSDEIHRRTAEISIPENNKMIAYLAIFQEEKKGFPQGIPSIVKQHLPQIAAQLEQKLGQQNPQEEMMEGPEEQMEQQPPMQMYGGEGYYVHGGGRQSNSYLPMYGEYTYGGNYYDTGGQFDETTTMGPYGQLPQFGYAGQNYYAPGGGVNLDDDDDFAPLDENDPDYKRLKKFFDQYGVKGKKGQIIISDIDPNDIEEFTRLTDKFGFDRSKEKGGYKIIQDRTEGYTFIPKGSKKASGFFGGYTPQVYENKVARSVLKKSEYDKLDELGKRKVFLKTLGIDTSNYSDDDLKDASKLYNDPEFFTKTLYPAFTKKYPAKTFRPQLKDDKRFGAEHFKAVPGAFTDELEGYKCVTGSDGKKTIETKSFKDDAEMTAEGYSSDLGQVTAECTNIPGGKQSSTTTTAEPGFICSVGPDGKTVIKKVSIGLRYKTEAEAAANCPRPGQQPPFDYTKPDKMAIGLAASAFPIKINPWRAPVDLASRRGVFYDPTLALATGVAGVNTATRNYPGSVENYSANANAAQLAAINQAVQQLGRYEDLNVGMGNQIEKEKMDIANEQAKLDSAMRTGLYNDNTVATQKFWNEAADYANKYLNTYSKAWNKRSYIDQLNNAAGRKFYYDPRTGRQVFKGNPGGFGALDDDGYAYGTTNPDPYDIFSSYYDKVSKSHKNASEDEKIRISRTLTDQYMRSRTSSRGRNNDDDILYDGVS
jgi:hypothetical protein